MSRSRRTLCGHGSDEPAYPLRSIAGYNSPAPERLDAALQHLADILNSLPGPIEGAISDLSPHDIAALMSRAPLGVRTRALQALGLPRMVPRTIGQALCRDVLSRLERVHLHDAIHSACVLTSPIRITLWSASQAWTNSNTRETTPQPVQQTADWPDPLLRLAFWSSIFAAVPDARLIAWAATQPWWLPRGLSETQGEALAAAAQSVIDASPDFNSFADPCDTTFDEDTVIATERKEDPEQDILVNDKYDADIGTAIHEPAPVAESPNAATMPSSPATKSVEEPVIMAEPIAQHVSSELLASGRRDRGHLTVTHAAAVDAVGRLAADVTGGLAPDREDIAIVATYLDELEALAAWLATTPINDRLIAADRPNIATIDLALKELEKAVAADSARTRLAELRMLTPAAGNLMLDNQLSELHATIDDTAGLDADPELVKSFLALAELADLIAIVGSTQADPQQAFDLQSRATAGLPPALALLPIAVLTGQLVRDAKYSTEAIESKPRTVDPQLAAESSEDTESSLPVEPEATASASTIDHTPFAEPSEQTVEAPAVAADPLLQKTSVSQPASMLAGAAPPASIAGTVCTLIAQQRFGLAASIAEHTGGQVARISALRLAALADAIRTETGPSAARLRHELELADNEAWSHEAATLLLVVPALLRAALVTGDPTPGALLTALAPRLENNLGVIAEQVGRRALQGVLIGNPLRTALADITELESSLTNARRDARDRLRPRTLRFKRATDIANRWLAADGSLGKLLLAAATDDRNRIGAVTASVLQLINHDSLAKEIDTLDTFFKGNSGKPVEGAARQDLLALAADALAQVSAWLEAVAAFERATTNSIAWATSELADMRAAILARTAGALAALDEQTVRDDTLAGAAAVAAHKSLTRTFALLDGSSLLAAGELLPDVVLTGELLKVPGAVVEPTSGLVTLPADAPVEGLLEAAELDWPDAFAAKVAKEEFQSAKYLLAALQNGTLPSASGLGDTASEILDAAKQRSRKELQEVRDQLLAQLRRARLQNEISEEQDGELTGLLDAADPGGRDDLDAVRSQLDTIGTLLPYYREEAAHRLKERLRALVNQSDRVEIDVAHIQRLIDDGQLSTAEELIYFLEVGEPVPSVTPRADLSRFFPAVPDAMSAGLTSAIVAAARDGGVVAECPVLDFTRLSTYTRKDVADALDAWRLIGSTPAEGRSRFDERAALLPALRLAGFEFQPTTKAQRLDLQKGRERRFIELSDVSWNGKAVVPQLGSKLGGRLRMLLCWGQPAEDLLMSWADHDTSGDAILVAYFGTMPTDARRRLAARVVHTDAPVAVLDDAALAYLAAHGERQFAAAMAVLLPFTSVQPYVRHKRSLVAPEMFYGRDSERKAVLSPEGTQVIFGGRGLGKSALLRDAKAAFEREAGRIAIHIELTTAEIGPESQSADAVWDVLLRDLEAAGVISTPRAARKGKSNHEIVRASVLSWLSADSRHRLLILLDESDGFFEADAPRFLETNRLKDLGQLSGAEGHAKVVFAGLHSVQRFAKMSNNTFKHLAQRPTVIGPLRPQFAYNLIARPMEALGYTFADSDLVNRILGYCSYQPFLLQMFGHRLVEHMHTRRGTGIAGSEPPFTVNRADVEAVEADPDLKADITSTFSDTLNLDPRYNVIANVLAWQAHEHGMDSRLSDVQLREECRSWWPAGFDSLDVEAFRAYLHEMVGLGVLAPNNDGAGWHLRSPNVLRMIGAQDRVMSELVNAAAETIPSEFIALSARRILPNGTRASLTAGQIDDLLGDHANQVRLVLGSTATGVERVTATMRAVCDDLAGRYKLIPSRGRKMFEDALIGGQPGERRVVLSDLLALDPKAKTCMASIEVALGRRPETPGVTRSVVLVSGAAQLGFWLEALTDEERPGLGVVSLRRFDRRTLRVWSLDTGQFATDERQTRLLTATSGWPLLVERAVELASEKESEDAGLAALERELNSPDGAANLISAVGLTVDESIATAFEHITALVGSDATLTDLMDAAFLSGHPAPASAVAVLNALGVFDIDDNGAYRVDPVLVRCWPYRQPIVDEDA